MSKKHKISIEFSIHTTSQSIHEQHMAHLQDVITMLNKLYMNTCHDYCQLEVNKFIEDDD
jgi:hypothetical protein